VPHSPTEFIIALGKLRYGDEWKGPLAADLETGRTVMRNVVSGSYALTWDHPLVLKAVASARDEADGLNKLLADVPRSLNHSDNPYDTRSLNETLEVARIVLVDLGKQTDFSSAHSKADDILVEIARAYGCPKDIIDAYEDVGKWYE
jgi:hypothetical protein